MYCWQTAWASSPLVHVWAAAQIARAPTVVGCKSQGVAINKCCLRVTSPDASLWNPGKQSHRGKSSAVRTALSKRCSLHGANWHGVNQQAGKICIQNLLTMVKEKKKRKKKQMRERTLFASKQKSDAVAYYDDPMITLCCKVWDINTYLHLVHIFSVLAQEWLTEMENLLLIWEQAC